MPARTPFRSVAAHAFPGMGGLGVGILAEAFGFDRSHRGMPSFAFSLCAEEPGFVRTDGGLTLFVEHGLDRLAAADLVFLTSWADPDRAPSPAVLEAVRAAYDRGAIIASSCSGTYVLAATGLLEGKRCTTHWRHADDLARRYPAIKLDPDVLYVDEGRIVTGAGAAACVDVCLYLLRREYGAVVANAIARDMVVPPHRDGGQAQYVPAPVPVDGHGRIAEVIAWARDHLDRPLTVERLAARALMSPRSFARHFRASTGTTPHAWLLAQRLHRAEELLETTDLSVEEVAHRCGFGSAAALREQFVRRRGVPPRDYRRAFAARC